MNHGFLSEYFEGVAAKTLKATEVDPRTSHGHEYQGVDAFRQFLGTPSEKTNIPVAYVWLTDDSVPIKNVLTGTWYNSRAKKDFRSAEYRLYYPTAAEEIVWRASPGDTLFFCKPKTGPLLAMSCPAESSIEKQLFWLFGLQAAEKFGENQLDLTRDPGKELDFAARYILELIGIEVSITDGKWLERLLKAFGPKFPSTEVFSKFARDNVAGIDPINAPDDALLEWIDFEERLFRTLEHHVVAERIKAGFENHKEVDVNGFVSFSLSVQNRRKARVGLALEHHVEAILIANHIQHERGATTENKSKPDFLFPGSAQYRDLRYPAARLAMLGTKSTCKDRWRQILSEANRIETKHLLTLEPSISEPQTDEMKGKNLKLVLPTRLHVTYKPSQKPWLMSFREFITVASRLRLET